jgi:glycine hydroxymethyltransferase
VDFEELIRLARAERPKIVLCGTTSYPRRDDYAAFRAVADEVGALAMADISHVGGLVAGGVLENPFDHGFDLVTTTTHKTLRGPRGGLILCRRELAAKVDRSVFPGLQGGPHMNTIAGIAVSLGKALRPAFRAYTVQVLRNARCLAAHLLERGATLVTGGTDNHLMVLDTQQSFGIDGRRAEQTLDAVRITTNKQVIPDDPRPPLRPSGIRLGTPAATTRGMGELEMRRIAAWIVEALREHQNQPRLRELRRDVERFCSAFPVPGLGRLRETPEAEWQGSREAVLRTSSG